MDVVSTVGQGTTFTMRLPVYSDAFAFAESFREMRGTLGTNGEQTVSLIVIQAQSLLTADGRPSHQQLQPVVDDVRRHLHRGDLVLVLDPAWIVVLALTNAEGVRAIVKRLQSILADGPRLQCGAAIYPTDGTDPAALFTCAIGRVGQPLDRLEQRSGAKAAPTRVVG